MNNKKNILFATLAFVGLIVGVSSFTWNGQASYEYKTITVIESIVPMGIGRSRIIEHQQKADYKSMTTQNTTEKGKQKNKADRGAAKIDNYSETKLLNFYSGVGINFQNIASNDALISSKINDMVNNGWELSFVNTGVESKGSKDDKTGLFITRLMFKKAK